MHVSLSTNSVRVETYCRPGAVPDVARVPDAGARRVDVEVPALVVVLEVLDGDPAALAV